MFATRVNHFHHRVISQRGSDMGHEIRLAVHHRYRHTENLRGVGNLATPGHARMREGQVQDVRRIVGEQRINLRQRAKVLSTRNIRPDCPGTRADWEKVLSVNVIGTSLVSRHAVAAMKEGGGAIVNIASINGLIAMPDWMTYNASKAAVVEMSKSMAMDLAPFDIRVNAVCPGVTHTPALEKVFEELGMSGQDVFDQIVAPRCLIKRYATPEDIASASLYLASDEASFVTGATLVVDGGYTA